MPIRKLVNGFVALLMLASGAALADHNPVPPRSKPEAAKDLLEHAVMALEKEGPVRAFAQFNNQKGKYVKRDLYVFVIDMKGNYHASGGTPDVVGLNVLETRDAQGKPLFKEMIDIAKTKGSGTLDYVWLNRPANKVENKHTFIQRSGDYILGVGYYTPRASAEQARIFFDEAVSFMERNGAQKAFDAFNEPNGHFVRGDLYVFVLDINDGSFKAFGANPDVVGQKFGDLRDAQGQPIQQQMVSIAKARGEGTLDYVWRNPATNKIEKKTSFLKRVGEYVLGVGYYRQPG